jgi:long-chain acyl-CoA synthetase
MAARNLADLVRAAAVAHPDKPALIADQVTVSWAEFDGLVDRAAGGLLSTGRKPGDRVGLLLPNCVEFAIGYFGTLRAGLVAVPFNTGYTAAELGFQLTDAGVALVLTDVDHVDLVAGLSDDERVVLGDEAGSWDRLLSSGEPTSEADGASAAGGEDLALLLYTSGTSGRPRGAMLSHRALLANLDQLVRIDPPVVQPADRVLLVLPLFHVYGLNSGLGMVAKAGSTGVLSRRFDPVETLKLVRDEQVSVIVGAPPMYVAWSMLPDLGESFTTVRLALSGAAPLPPSVLTAVLETSGHHVFEGYGLTETAPVVATTLCSPVAKPGSVGRPVPGVAIKILNGDEGEVDEDDPGEILVRGDNLFSGYWPGGEGGPDEAGWFRTGDIAYADADGDLFLVDRTKELIIVSGFNVYPREVEDVLRDHYAVQEVAVIGVPHPYTGETVKALVVPRPGLVPSAESLIDHAAARLARFKCPTVVEFVEWLPRSLIGKVAKGRFRESYSSSDGPVEPAPERAVRGQGTPIETAPPNG